PALLCRSDGGDAGGDRSRLARRFRRRLPEFAMKVTQLGHPTTLPQSPGAAVLETVPNPHPGLVYLVRFTCPEFTSLCPVTGQPDFAHFVIDYVPEAKILESKSLNLYLAPFPNHAAFHEDCPLAIARRLVETLDPH